MDTKVFAYLFLLLSVGVLRVCSKTTIDPEVIIDPWKTWCVAKPSLSEAELLGIVNYACSHVDCKILQEGGACYLPNNLMNHASIAMNIYYQANEGSNPSEFYFSDSGLVTLNDPSYGDCEYA